ncbi:MAG: hypothetical protein ACI9UK_001402 [Candidatus Krumholzibacteriia bacterium]|jgi:hypothetical protein
MPLSTSSFKRETPKTNWSFAGLVALVIFVVAIAAWEMRVRAEAYTPSIEDSKDLWAAARSRISDDPDQTVVVGSSRIQFDLDLDTWAAAHDGDIPIQLAIPGSNPLAILEDVAASEFRGNLILGVTPGLWFVPQGGPVYLTADALDRFHNWSPSQQTSLVLGKFLQNRLAMINSEDLKLTNLLSRIQLADRPGTKAHLPPVLPPYFAGTDEYRQAYMWSQCALESPLARKIQQIWAPLFTPPPPPPGVPMADFKAGFAKHMDVQFVRIQAAVATVQARGGRVVFVRPPSTGGLRSLEAKFSPREGVWDRMLADTGAPGIHFEDYAELAQFKCPEWSHLNASDAVTYSQALVPMIMAALAKQQ